jgi:hypothetical protein
MFSMTGTEVDHILKDVIPSKDSNESFVKTAACGLQDEVGFAPRTDRISGLVLILNRIVLASLNSNEVLALRWALVDKVLSIA